MLGYYYVRDNYTGQQFGSSDFEDFNVGPNLAQQNADVARENAAKLGFETTPQTVHADFNASVASKPGIQFYTNRIESADPTISIYGGAKKSQDGTATVTGKEIEWNLGDGTLRTGPADEERFSHTYAAPGKYKITAKITANNGKTRSWSDTVIIDPPLEIAASVESSSSAGTAMLVSPNYGTGQGRLVSATWSCGGTTLYGLTPVCPGTKGGTATVTAADGAGNTATTSVEYPATPKLKVIKVKLSPKKPKAGKGSKLTVKIKNVGGSTATDVKVCAKTAKAPGSKAKPGCKKLGGVKGGKSKTGKFTIKLGKKVKKKFKVKLTVTGTNVKKVKSTKSYKPKPVKK